MEIYSKSNALQTNVSTDKLKEEVIKTVSIALPGHSEHINRQGNTELARLDGTSNTVI